MHYAEFAEDEVRLSLVSSLMLNRELTWLSESGLVQCYQGVREQQVENHRAEGRQASQGLRAVREGALSG